MAILELAKVLGYLACHARPAQTTRGWRTPWSGKKGAPDILIAGRGRLIFIECKSQIGKLDPDQEEWRQSIEEGPAEYYLIRPSDWDEVVAILNRF